MSSYSGPRSRGEKLRVKFLKLALLLFGIVAAYNVIKVVT